MYLYERVEQILKNEGLSRKQLAHLLDVPQNTFNRYFCQEQQTKLTQHLWNIFSIFPYISREWLFFDEGDMFASGTKNTVHKPQREQEAIKIASVPVVGFASCGILGWEGEMTIPMSATVPHINSRTIVVMANGESMIPAGIGHGHLCFCEPDLEPLRGDIVYVRRHDNLGTLKTFLGWGLEAGIPEATKGELCLRGWLDRNELGQQREIILTVDKILVKTVAPVVFVRRRM